MYAALATLAYAARLRARRDGGLHRERRLAPAIGGGRARGIPVLSLRRRDDARRQSRDSRRSRARARAAARIVPVSDPQEWPAAAKVSRAVPARAHEGGARPEGGETARPRPPLVRVCRPSLTMTPPRD